MTDRKNRIVNGNSFDIQKAEKKSTKSKAKPVRSPNTKMTKENALSYFAEVPKDWIRFDFTNAEAFKGTAPAYCCIGGTVVKGKNWINILSGIVENEFLKKNVTLGVLFKESLHPKKTNKPFFVKERADLHRGTKLSNGYWINVNWSIPHLIKIIQAFCQHCGYPQKQIVLYGIPKGGVADGCNDLSLTKNISSNFDMEQAEVFLKKTCLYGATVQEVIDSISPGAAFEPTQNALEQNPNVIAMPGNRYVHVGCFVDLKEAEEKLRKILRTHFTQFCGYSNNQLLFGAASQELSMFLNDNDCENIDAVYAVARFLFEKKALAGEPYKFFSPHIFEVEPDYPMNLRGLMIHLARNNGGILHAIDAKNYLQKIMLSYGSMSQLLQIGTANTFLMYDDDRYLLSETLGIDDTWCRQVHDQMDDLFRKANVAYVIPRDISTAWLRTLPALPPHLEWTRLLLQEILNKYPAIGFKSISADIPQSHHTLSAAFVPMDSPLQSFPDVVTLFMEERHRLPKRMQREELRMELRNAGILKNDELIYALPKALDDYRFAWTNENKYVYIRGNK